MPTYSYRGLDKAGKHISGSIAADDERTALAQIKALGLYPMDLRPARADGRAATSAQPHAAPTQMRPRPGRGVGTGDLTVLSRQLANLVAGGLPLMRTFAALTEHTENPTLRAALERMQRDVQTGKSLSEALAAHPRIFPPLYVSMVRAGEASGQLSTVLEWLASYLEKEQSRRMQIRSALAYPVLLVTVGMISVFLLITLVVPKFVAIFEEFEQALPTPTVVLLGVSSVVSRWWWAIIVGIAFIVFGLRQYGRTPEGRFQIDTWKLRLPLFGKLGLKAEVSRFARTTATLLQGGVTLLDAVGIVREVLGNSVLARGADQAREGMREGASFADRLRETGAFPPLLVRMVGVGEETGDLQGVLNTVANTYDVEVDATLKSIVSLLEPLIIVTMGGIIAFIILAMLLPVFQINLLAG